MFSSHEPYSPKHAKRFHLLLQSCRSECWLPGARCRPTRCWAWPSSPARPESCCCTAASWWAAPRWPSAALSGCHCPCSFTDQNMQSSVAAGVKPGPIRHSAFCCRDYRKLTILLSQMEMMKSKNGSSPAQWPGEFSCTFKESVILRNAVNLAGAVSQTWIQQTYLENDNINVTQLQWACSCLLSVVHLLVGNHRHFIPIHSGITYGKVKIKLLKNSLVLSLPLACAYPAVCNSSYVALDKSVR